MRFSAKLVCSMLLVVVAFFALGGSALLYGDFTAACKRKYKELAQAFATERAQNFAALLFEQGDKFFVIFLVFARGARGKYKRILRCGGEFFDELYKFRVVAARIYSAAEPDGVVLRQIVFPNVVEIGDGEGSNFRHSLGYLHRVSNMS